MKKDNLSQFVESIEKKIIEKIQFQEQKKTKSTLKLQQANNFGVDHGKVNSTDGYHSSISSVEDNQKNMVVGRGLIEQADKNKNASKSLLQKQRKNIEKNSKEINQRLLKMSTTKAPPNKPQHHAATHAYNPYSTLLHSQSQSPNKIQENNQKTLQYSRLFSKGQSELKQNIQWKNGQRERLKLYFKHHCQLIKDYPKLSTFQHVKTILNTLNVTEWMVFCKNLGIGCRLKAGHPEGLRILSCLFKKYQDSDKRLAYDKFQMLVAEVILYMTQEELIYLRSQDMSQQKYQQLKKQKIDQIIDWMNLNDNKKHKKKLKQIGIMCSQQVYSIPKQGLQSQRNAQNKKNNSLIQSRLQRPSMPILDSTSTNNAPKPQKLPKIYRNFVQRKQSKLMHNLGISNIDKIIPTEDTKNFLQNYIGMNDIYLKQYFKKQNQVKSGILSKLEASHRVDHRRPGYGASKGRSLGKLYFR